MMMPEIALHTPYILGNSDEELGRLARQALFFSSSTDRILRCAGLAPGMRVLDVGCGVGDVSLLASAIVGTRGSILGIDRDGRALRTAASRVSLEGSGSIDFMQAEIVGFEDDGGFDAVIGRFILLHFNDASRVLSKARTLLRSGGLLVFAEMDISSATITPPTPLLSRCLEWIVALYGRSGLQPNMGSQLYRSFRLAGLTPTCVADCRVEHGPHAACLRYVVDTLRSMAPALAAAGIVGDDELGIDDLLTRLELEVADADPCMIFPRFVGAWART